MLPFMWVAVVLVGAGLQNAMTSSEECASAEAEGYRIERSLMDCVAPPFYNPSVSLSRFLVPRGFVCFDHWPGARSCNLPCSRTCKPEAVTSSAAHVSRNREEHPPAVPSSRLSGRKGLPTPVPEG